MLYVTLNIDFKNNNKVLVDSKRNENHPPKKKKKKKNQRKENQSIVMISLSQDNVYVWLVEETERLVLINLVNWLVQMVYPIIVLRTFANWMNLTLYEGYRGEQLHFEEVEKT